MQEENFRYKAKKGIYWTFFNQFSLNVMRFVVGIVMARLLTPEDYGITALPSVFFLIASAIIDGGFSTALIRKPEVTEEDLSTSFYYSICVGFFLYLCLFFAAPLIAKFYNTPILVPLIRVTALSFLWGPLATPQNVILNRRLDFKTQAKISIISSVFSAIVGLSVAFAGYGLWALVASGLASSLLSLVLTWLSVKWLPRAKWSKDSFLYLWGFGNKLLASSLLQTVYTNITPIIVGKFYSTKDLGIYNRAQGYADLPATQISNMVQKVTFPLLCKAQDNDERLSSIYRKLIRDIAFVSFPIFFALIALARPLIIVFITEKWAACIILLQLICFYKMWGPLSWMNLNVLQVKGRSDLFLKLDVKKKIIGLIIICLFLPFGLTAYCVGLIFNQIYVMYVNMQMTSKVINLSLSQQLKDLGPTYLLSILMFVLMMVINLVLHNYILQLIVSPIIGILFYGLIAYLFKFEEFEAIKYMLTRKK